MEQKYLFVGEYYASYTFGSVVFISTEEELKTFSLNGLDVILNPVENQIRKVRELGGWAGITVEDFWLRVDAGNFTDEFKAGLREMLAFDPKSPNSGYPGYQDGRIRTDWIFGNPTDGIYIVYKLPVEDNHEGVQIISDTYDMA